MLAKRRAFLFALSGVGMSTAWGEPVGDVAKLPSPEKMASDLATIGPVPKPVDPVPVDEIDKALHRAIDFLVHDQNPNGSWGSAERTKELNIYAPVPGAHRGFRGATTALVISSIIESRTERDDALKALDRGETWLLENLGKVRRGSSDAIYNVWAHSYGVSALVRMHERHRNDEAKQKQIRDAIDVQLDLLNRYETVYGGWGYYDFAAHTQKPSGDPNSFTTATAYIAIEEARRRVGVEPPKKLVDRAVAAIKRQKRPDASYLYGEDFRLNPKSTINRPGGSLGRSQACNLALRWSGDTSITDEVLKTWLNRLYARNMWLDIGRKRPIPHEAWFLVAGYFYYYGHFYAAMCIDELPAEQRGPFQDHLARIILPHQEKDGSWWDYPLYNYHQQYGTAFAIMTLARCKKAP